jgi:hypothetical protein
MEGNKEFQHKFQAKLLSSIDNYKWRLYIEFEINIMSCS